MSSVLRFLAACGVTANWITLSRWVFLPYMAVCYSNQQWVSGAFLYVASIVPDWFDGAFARWQQGSRPILTKAEESRLSWWQIITYPGVTHFGMWLDPFTDKLGNILALCFVGPLWLSWWLIAPIILIDIFLQFGARPLKQYYKVETAAANDWGKFKNQFQGWTIALMPLVKVWGPQFVIYLASCAALGMALLSLRGHLLPVYRKLRSTR